MRETVAARVDDAVTITTLTLPWPHTPFGPVAEVDEASGDEGQLTRAPADYLHDTRR